MRGIDSFDILLVNYLQQKYSDYCYYKNKLIHTFALSL
jgi:hypothetical protein